MDEPKIVISELTRQQRRVLGVLLEKGFTTPAAYPLTLKATTTGCNQKSNRSPLVDWDEDQVLSALEELRKMGLAAEVHTDGGRALRYRHYVRRRCEFNEPQLAIMTELMLRGRQQLGELRSRASRMVHIENQAALRTELNSLLEKGCIQASGPLERRGVEVDHNWYRERENKQLSADTASQPEPTASEMQAGERVPAAEVVPTAVPHAASQNELTELRSANQQLRGDIDVLMEELELLRTEVRDLNGNFEDLKRQLGG